MAGTTKASARATSAAPKRSLFSFSAAKAAKPAAAGRPKAAAKSAAARRAPKAAGRGAAAAKAPTGVKAQRFQLTLPGLQSKNAKGFTVTLGFTKANELFVGRLAMIGFAAATLGEILTGKGAIAQLGFETGISPVDADGFVLALIGFNLLAALAPATGKFVPEEDDTLPGDERRPGALQDTRISLATPGRFFGVDGFGFTKANELFVGRLAQLGFAAALVGELLTGQGPLAQLGLETGIPLTEAEPLLLFSIIFTLFAAVNEGTGKFVEED